MLKNVTLKADEYLLSLARTKASQEKKSLSEIFQEWLDIYVSNNEEDYYQLMERLSYAEAGKGFNRDELNER